VGDADALVCGTMASVEQHLAHVAAVIGREPSAPLLAAMNILILPKRTLAITDTYVNEDPSAEQVAHITAMAARELKRFGLVPKVALLSHSNFGSRPTASSRKMRAAREMLRQLAPDVEVDGEMHGDAALMPAIRDQLHPGSELNGEANLLVMPNLDAANIAFNLLKAANTTGAMVGPILLGSARARCTLLTSTATVRRLVNITALAVVEAQKQPG